MDFRVIRKYFYQKWRGHSLKNNTRREMVFLLLGAPRYALGFGNLLRLTFIRVNAVMDDEAIIGLFMDKEMAQFVRFAAVFPSGEMFFDLSLQQIIPVVDHDMSKLMAYLDLPNIFHEVGVDLTSAGPDPMSAPEAFYLKLLWPEYIDSDEKYVAIVIAGILTTRWDLDQNSLSLPPYSMHLTEVGMHLKSLEAVDASLAWALPALKNEGLRLARFLGKSDTERYFRVTESPCHHSDKVVSLNVSLIWKDVERLWSMHDIGLYLRDGEHLCGREMMSLDGIEEHMAHITRACAEVALSDDHENKEPAAKFVVEDRYVMPKLCVERPRSLVSCDGQSATPVAVEFNSAPTTMAYRSDGMRSVRVPPVKKRSPLGDLVYNNAQVDARRIVASMEGRRAKIVAAAPAGSENDIENIRVLY